MIYVTSSPIRASLVAVVVVACSWMRPALAEEAPAASDSPSPTDGAAPAELAPAPTAPGPIAIAADPLPAPVPVAGDDDEEEKKPLVEVTPTGYVETYYAYNANRPSNGVTNFRAFDNRHNSLTLLNLALGVDVKADKAFARVMLQAGATGDTYVGLSEPSHAATSGAGESNGNAWRHVQEAYVGWDGAVRVDAGLFLSPIGPESMAVKDQWTWSRSNLFYGLPFYHTGARVARDFGKRTTVRAAVYNGWNSVVDNNEEKSLSLKITHHFSDDITFDAQYLGGVERAQGAPEGRAWRNLFDSYIQFKVHKRVELLVNSDIGFEPNRIGTSGWAAAALFARVQLHKRVYVAAAGDIFTEVTAKRGLQEADAIFWPSGWVSSQWVTLDVRPASFASLRFELRHDQSAARMYFRGNTFVDPATGSAIANARAQNTATVGAVVWF